MPATLPGRSRDAGRIGGGRWQFHDPFTAEMSDISISFSWWAIAWFAAGEAAPLTLIVVAILGAARLLARRAGSSGLSRWLQISLVPVGAVWLAGIGFWAFALADQIRTCLAASRCDSKPRCRPA